MGTGKTTNKLKTDVKHRVAAGNNVSTETKYNTKQREIRRKKNILQETTFLPEGGVKASVNEYDRN